MKGVGLYIAAFGYSSPSTTLSWRKAALVR